MRLRRLGAGLPTAVWVKCEHENPGGSIKDRTAVAIVADAETRGALYPGATIIEATAGNTGLSLAHLGAEGGYKVVCVMPEKMSHDKRSALRALGAEVIIAPNEPPDHPDNFQRVAERLAVERGWFLADQFRNPANVMAHYETTGPEILAQSNGNIGAFVAGAGTGGTLSGVGRRLKEHSAKIQIVLADPVGSALAQWLETGCPGSSASYAVEGIGQSAPPANLDREILDRAERVSDAESFEVARRLARDEGLEVGGSAGTNVAAALRVAASGTLSGPVVTVLPDSSDRYASQPWMSVAARG